MKDINQDIRAVPIIRQRLEAGGGDVESMTGTAGPVSSRRPTSKGGLEDSTDAFCSYPSRSLRQSVVRLMPSRMAAACGLSSQSWRTCLMSSR